MRRDVVPAFRGALRPSSSSKLGRAATPPSSQLRCRQILDSDLEAVADVLTRGFPSRTRGYWTHALDILRSRQRIPGCPDYGFLLEAGGVVVGVHLLIFSKRGNPPEAIRCNTSSWCVDPEYRGQAALLASAASKLKSVTYLNTSAARHTWPILEALGYRRYSQGQFVAIPALGMNNRAKVARFADCASHQDLPEYELMRAHAEAGCLAIVCATEDGLVPFVLLRRRTSYAPFGLMQLIYCRDIETFVVSAGPIGQFLLRQGVFGVICASDGPIGGLPGLFLKNKNPYFYKGLDRPQANDLAFTEMVLFGP